MNLAFDKAGDLLVLSSDGPEGTVYSFRPGSPEDQITVLCRSNAKPHPGAHGSAAGELLEQRRIQQPARLHHHDIHNDGRDVCEDVSTPKASEYVSPDGSLFLPAGRVFQQGPADPTGWRFSDNLDTYGLVGAVPGQRVYVSNESEDRTYSALVAADGTLRDLRSFAERGGESVAVDGNGNVYVANGQIFVYDPAGKKIGEIDVPDAPSNSSLAARTVALCSSSLTTRSSQQEKSLQIDPIDLTYSLPNSRQHANYFS